METQKSKMMKNGSLNEGDEKICDVNELWKKCLLINLFAFDGGINKWIECLLIYIAYILVNNLVGDPIFLFSLSKREESERVRIV